MSTSNLYEALCGLLLIGLAVLAARNFSRIRARLARENEIHADDLTNSGIDNRYLIFVASAALLFGELAIIRIHASYFHLVAVYKNISLLSCFLGLGIGFARGGRGLPPTIVVLPVICYQIALLHLLRMIGVGDILQNPSWENMALGMRWSWTSLADTYLFLAALFVGNALCFVPIGQTVGHLIARTPPLQAYSWNLLGSLAGVLLFSLMSQLWSPPTAWLCVLGAGVLVLIPRAAHLVPSLAALLLTVTFISVPTRVQEHDIYSPYQVLTLANSHRYKGVPEVRVNNAYFQWIIDLSQTDIEDGRIGHYKLPYLVRPSPETVLIVGSGTGNDVSSALANDAGRIDAVEIDPVIIELGREIHPQRPYESERVRLHIDDARSFLKSTDNRYDLIVFGLLDSHTELANMGSVRLDSYVYTVESFRAARDRLSEDGALCISFALLSEPQGKKLFDMLTLAFDGKPPRAFRTLYAGGTTFCASNGAIALEHGTGGVAEVTDEIRRVSEPVDPATDDWPFFYMTRAGFPFSYAAIMLVLGLLSFYTASRLIPREGVPFSWPAFFLGAGFMLIQTKAITEIALLFGGTWVVVSVVISAILLMAFLSNLLVLNNRAPRPSLTYLGLVLTLLAGFLVSRSGIYAGGGALPQVVAVITLTGPIFFAGFAFSRELESTSSVSAVLYANLLGAMVGGILEYLSMMSGFSALYLLAAAMYCSAYAASRARKGGAPAVASGSD